jgi:cell division protein FtsX
MAARLKMAVVEDVAAPELVPPVTSTMATTVATAITTTLAAGASGVWCVLGSAISPPWTPDPDFRIPDTNVIR